MKISPATKLFAAIGAAYLVWFLVAALTGIRGPWGINQ